MMILTSRGLGGCMLLPVVSVMPAADELSPDVDGAEDTEDADGSDSVLVLSGASKHIM